MAFFNYVQIFYAIMPSRCGASHYTMHFITGSDSKYLGALVLHVQSIQAMHGPHRNKGVYDDERNPSRQTSEGNCNIVKECSAIAKQTYTCGLISNRKRCRRSIQGASVCMYLKCALGKTFVCALANMEIRLNTQQRKSVDIVPACGSVSITCPTCKEKESLLRYFVT